MTCDPQAMVEDRINRVLTQYRESPKLLHVLRTYLSAVAEVHAEVCEIPERFDLQTATGDQLTLIGKRMGWSRCHCVCDAEPVFGFECPDGVDLRPIVGFCDVTGTWQDCSSGLSDICINDDDMYRRFLQVRSYQFLNMYDLASLEASLRIFFGPSASVMYSGQGRVVVTPGRDLTSTEISLLQLFPRVLPVALGIRVLFHFGPIKVFGFGDGWGGFMEPDMELTFSTEAYQRTGEIFGFCEGFSGFCATWTDDGLPLLSGQLDLNGGEMPLVDENNAPIYTGPLKQDPSWLCRSNAPWMCEIDVHPYDC